MTTLNVPDMHCNMCVARITKALNEENLRFTVDLSSKTVQVDGDESAVARAVERLDDLGFEAKEGNRE